MVSHQSLRGRCVIAVDATGVGEPVVDMLRLGQLGCEVSAVNITGGDGETRSGNVWHVPNLDLMAGVQVLIEKADEGNRSAGERIYRCAINGGERRQAAGRKRGQIGFGTRRLPGI